MKPDNFVKMWRLEPGTHSLVSFYSSSTKNSSLRIISKMSKLDFIFKTFNKIKFRSEIALSDFLVLNQLLGQNLTCQKNK